MTRRSPRFTPVLATVLAVFGGACGIAPDGGDGSGAPEAAGTGADAVEGDLLVSAAASLTEAFGEMAAAFGTAHPGVSVRLNLAGSATLRAQILEGAPADVFASADRANMERVAAAGEAAGEPVLFARNLLAIAVPAGNPAGVTGLGDLGREEILVGLCARGVPCGDFARAVLDRAGVTPAPDTEEPDVRALLTKVALGELDAAVVYVTDVRAAGGAVEGIAIPDTENVTADYPVAVLAGAPHPVAARAFVDFVLSPSGRAILARHGFAAP